MMVKKLIKITTVSTLSLFSTGRAFAAGIGCDDKSFGPIAAALCKNPSKEAVGGQLNRVISVIIGVMTAVAAIWFIFQFIQGGYQWLSSGGDKNALQEARDRIINALIGLIIVVAAWIVIGIVGGILGIPILNPGEMLLNLGK